MRNVILNHDQFFLSGFCQYICKDFHLLGGRLIVECDLILQLDLDLQSCIPWEHITPQLKSLRSSYVRDYNTATD